MNDIGFWKLPPFRVEFLARAQDMTDGVDWASSAYGVPSLWKKTKGEGVSVAVLDTGIAEHDALDGAVSMGRSFLAGEIPENIADISGHGTHVAGIIAARRGPAMGVAPASKLMIFKCLSGNGMGSLVGVSEAMQAAIESKADIISMSLGSQYPDQAMYEKVKAAKAAGILIVCAAGNDGAGVNFPAAFPECIGVSAVGRLGEACAFSSRGSEVMVAAPGSQITSTWIRNSYATLSGTSMSAPFVAGILALYIASKRANGEAVTEASIKEAVKETSMDVGDCGKDDLYGWGLINPPAMIEKKSIAKNKTTEK